MQRSREIELLAHINRLEFAIEKLTIRADNWRAAAKAVGAPAQDRKRHEAEQHMTNLTTIEELPALHVLVRFGKDIPPDLQGRVMLHMEKELREAGLDAEVFKKSIGDDSKLRSSMTAEQRAKL